MKIAIITDTHLSSKNIALIESIFDQAIAYLKKEDIQNLFHAGDWFTSRTGQSVEVLVATQRILHKLDDAGIDLHIIA